MKKTLFVLLLLAAAAVAFVAFQNKEQLVSVSGGNMRVTAVENTGDAAEVRAILARARVAVDSIKRPVLGEASVNLNKYIPESPLMNFAADALLLMAQRHSASPVDIAITNKGGLRSNIAAGTVTFGDIYNVFPFENTLALLTLSGEQLLQLCGEIASVGGEAIAGMRLVITPEGELVSATVGGKVIDPRGRYRVATSDYLAQGNDKMTALALGIEREILPHVTIRDIVVDYVKELTAAGKKLHAECDGRIIVADK